MSFQLPARHAGSGDSQPRWSGAAILVESMLLLVFLIASLAIFTQMFSASLERAEESRELTAAVAAASGAAERFAAHPSQASGETVVGDLRVVCDVQAEPHQVGTLYRADISVFRMDANGDGADASADGGGAGVGDEAIYSISTSKFESEVG